MSAGRGRRRAHHEEEHENHERWLVTYADMLTVLMALFIVMFAISIVDAKKFDQLKSGMHDAFGNGQEALEGGEGLLDGGQSAMTMDVKAAIDALQQQQARTDAVLQEQLNLEAARDQIVQALTERGLQNSVRFQLDERGLTVSIITDQVLFETGSADLQPAGRPVLDGIVPALSRLPNPVSIEGHTDDRPITSGRFPTNWELSTARATTVLRYLIEAHGLPANRLAAAGFADQRPVVPGTDDAARSTNRRVEVVVLSTARTEPIAVPATAVTPEHAVEPAPHAAAPAPRTEGEH